VNLKRENSMTAITHSFHAQQKKEVEVKQERKKQQGIDMSSVCSLILGGGQGTRLFPLTQSCCKPAILFGGRYRLIDVPISNALNANIRKNYVITQLLSSSLHHHLFQTYHSNSFGFIEILAAEQKPGKALWFQGTADAIRQSLEYLVETPAEYFLILSGDQLYSMDFQDMLAYAQEKNSDVLVATLPVSEKDARRMGIMKVNEEQRIIDFYEKPNEIELLHRMKTSKEALKEMKLDAASDADFLGSMGIYLFKRSALFNLLQQDPREDFGKHLIPTKVKEGNIFAYMHQSYWEDIGTIESFYKANMALIDSAPPFNCHSEVNPIYSNRYHLPGPKLSNVQVQDAIICEGAIVDAHAITNSIIGQRAVIGKGCVVENSYLMGNDFYQAPMRHYNALPEKLCIEEDSVIKNAIIDKNVHIGKGVRLVNEEGLKQYDGDGIYIRDGIIVVSRGVTIPNGFHL
jgi:glucose-1-phosphate adenylyltransferase